MPDKGSGREELPHVQGAGRQPRVPGCNSTGAAIPRQSSGVVAERSYPTSEVGAAAESARLQRRRNGQEELPKSEVGGSGREKLPRVRGQGRRLRGDTPRKRSGAAKSMI